VAARRVDVAREARDVDDRAGIRVPATTTMVQPVQASRVRQQQLRRPYAQTQTQRLERGVAVFE
jgi:hypothetical protein